jgi:hypothetical protein
MAGVNCGKLDFTEIPLEDLYANENNVWIKAEVEERILIIKDKEDNERPYAIIKFPNKCSATVCDDQQNLKNEVGFMLSNHLNYPKADKKLEIGECIKTKTKALELPQNIKDNIDNINAGTDLHSCNIDAYTAPAVVPAAAIIPMRSKIFTYGPWLSSNFWSSKGGIDIQVNTDLCPWVFGGKDVMDNIGQGIVQEQSIGLIRSETGSVTVPSLPGTVLLNGNPIDFTRVGLSLGEAGPSLSGINFSFGSNGVSTTYEFRTYTPKFGSMSKHNVDRIKKISQNRNEIIKFFRGQQINQHRINSRMALFGGAGARNNRPLVRGRNNQPSLDCILTGSMYDFRKTDGNIYGQVSNVGYTTLAKSTSEMIDNYEKKAFIGVDGLFSPISISGDGNFPRYVSAFEASHKSSSIYAQPPFTTGTCVNPQIPSDHDVYNLSIKNLYLNPISNPGSIPHHPSGDEHLGHSISVVGRENEVPASGLETHLYDNDTEEKYSKDYRFLGMRGPLVLHSWGYDVDGKPIPNEIDTESAAKSGIFKGQGNFFQSEGLKDEFLKDWLQKPATWPAGPIDLRFDRERGVWVSPQPYKIIVARVIKDVPAFGSGVGNVINVSNSKRYGRKLYDKDGKPIIEEDICPEENDDSSEENNEEWILVNIGKCESDESDSNTIEVVKSIDSLNIQGSNLVLNYTKVKIKVLDVISSSSNSISIPVTDCDTPPPTDPYEPYEPTPTPTPTTTLTPTPTTTLTPTPTPTSSPTPTEDETEKTPIIKLVDRIGQSYSVNNLVYAYYDTYTHEYIIFTSGSGDSILAYGYLISSEKINITGYAGGDNIINQVIDFTNPLKLDIPNLDNGCVVYGVVSKMNIKPIEN